MERRQERTGTTLLPLTPPEELSAEAQVLWDAILADQMQSGMYQNSDRFMLVELVEMLAEAKAFRRALRACDDRAGSQARYLRIGYEKCMMMALKISAEFGISPVARLRLGLGQIKAQTLLEALDQLPD